MYLAIRFVYREISYAFLKHSGILFSGNRRILMQRILQFRIGSNQVNCWTCDSLIFFHRPRHYNVSDGVNCVCRTYNGTDDTRCHPYCVRHSCICIHLANYTAFSH